ncbi:MAG: class II glutamine amidotransferase [Zavarzinella sp.]
MSNITSDIFAFSFDALCSPTISLKYPAAPHGTHTLGWGLAWYPGDARAARVAKDPTAHDDVGMQQIMSEWESFRSTVYFCKVQGAAKGYTHNETQPFTRSFAGKDWLFMHNGDLDKISLMQLHTDKSRFLEPLGRTDSELAFLYLLSQIGQINVGSLSSVNHESLSGWFERLDPLGSADLCLTDGVTVVCFLGTRTERAMYYTRIQPPKRENYFESVAATFSLEDPRDTYRTALVFSSIPFDHGRWVPMQPGQLIIARRGAIVWNSHAHLEEHFSQSLPVTSPTVAVSVPVGQFSPTQPEQAQTVVEIPPMVHESVVNIRAITHTADGQPLMYRLYDVTHTTSYSYDQAVDHSSHVFRLQPVDNHLQEVTHASLSISMVGEEIQFEDVFGNHMVHYIIKNSYNTLTVRSKSRVKIYAMPPDDYSVSVRRTSLPLVWMPWQRQMMMPYLLPEELPETQLEELTSYAMSFVERNKFRLLDTLNDINLSIYRDYNYQPGVTSLETTPFQVYASRGGVCQDFANLFICLARLLSIPARYRMGYIYTGANYENKIQSEASHAWVEVYLPYVGWRGFDPTNGCVVAQDHIRVACGRHFRDATPTSGTIFKGGGKESLTVDVKIEQVHH